MKQITLTCTGGNYPYSLARHEPGKIKATLSIAGDQIRLRIEDTSNIDRWEEFQGCACELAVFVRVARGQGQQLR